MVVRSEKKKGIAILGSTGSIGTQALDVIKAHPKLFDVIVITAENNAELLVEQARFFKPDCVVIGNELKYKFVSEALAHEPIKVYTGKEALAQVVEHSDIEQVLTAMVGYSGLLPTIKAIEAGKNIALANKETLVIAGELITKLAHEKRVEIIPVDSEHSAIFQCLTGEFQNKIEKIYLTASGGPFRKFSKNELEHVSPEMALKHPTWNMGPKITIDSASLMNKGLEVIEAKWLFALQPDQIDVVIHPQSIIHSIVQFEDGSMKAQMGLPDMKLPIQYALTFPQRTGPGFKRFNFTSYPVLEFEPVDLEKFRNLGISYKVLKKGGNAPCVMNAANEIVVDAFLNKKISFVQMSEIIEETLEKVEFVKDLRYEDYVYFNDKARIIAGELIIKNKN